MKQLFTRLLLVTLLTVLGTTMTWAQKSVLDESFGGGSLPKGWSIIDASYWDFTASNARFFAPFEDAVDTLFAPMTSLSDLDNEPSVTVTYKIAATSSNKTNLLEVLYRTSTQDGWTVLDTLQPSDEKIKWKMPLPGKPSIAQIAIAATYKLGGETRVYRVAVENKTEATEAPQNLRTENLKTNGVTVSWDPCNSIKFDKYNIKVNSTQMTDMTLMPDVLDNASSTNEWFELGNLQPDTEYWFYVQNDCGFGDVSPWAEINFKTPCLAISAPYSEKFEDGLTDCYTIIKDGASAEVSNEFAFNSTKSFKSVSAKGKANYLIFPEFSNSLQNYQVSFAVAQAETGNTYARTIVVGVCSEATAESFTAVKTLKLPKARTWESIVVSFKGYSGTGKYLAFKIGDEDKENRLFIDNISIEAAASCPKPIFLTASSITFNQAKFSWTAAGNETEWNLVISTKPLSDPGEIDPNEDKGEFADAISTNPYTITNLKPNTTYYAYLQAGCGSSEWTNAVQFKTTRAVEYPYVEHFDRMKPTAYTNNTSAIPDNWVFDDRGNNPSYTNYYDKQYTSDSYRPYVTTTQNHEQTAYVNASLFLRGTSGTTATSTNYTSIAMLPAMPKAVNTMMVTFWARGGIGNQTLKIGVANTQTNDLPQGKQLGENITEVGEVTVIKDEWKQYKVLLTNYTGSGRYITFYMKPGTSTPNVYIDDIVVDDAPDCNAVSTLTAEATGIDKATATWTDASSSTSWTIKVSSTEIDPSSANGDIIASKTVNTKSYNITGLSMGQTYYIYVSPTCGDEWKSTSVTTLVGLQVPYYNDFTNEYAGTGANRGPKNWKTGLTNNPSPAASSTNQPYVYGTAWTTPPADVVKNSLRLYNSATTATGTSGFPYAVLPELLNADVKDLKISFYGYYNSTSTTSTYAAKAGGPFGVLKIGVVASPNDIDKTNQFNKVTQIAAVRCKAGKVAEKFIIDCSAYAGSGKYIVFYSDTAKNNDMMIDNLSISLASAPQKVTDLKVASKTETTANFTWKENGLATKWEVRVFATEQENPEEGTPVWSATVKNGADTTAVGLTHSTPYYVYVRSVQDNGKGEWASISFWSEIGQWPVPYAEDFAAFMATSSYRSLPQYYLITDANGASIDNGNVYVYVNDLGGSKYLKMQATSSTQYKITTFAFPPFNKPVNTLQMTFIARSDATSSATESGQQTAIDQSHTEVGVLEADGTFVPLYSFKVNTPYEWEEQYMNFQSYTGAGGRIAVRMDYNKKNATNAIRLQNFNITEIPDCGRLLGVEVSEIDSTSAKLSWIKSKTETKWNLKVSTSALSNPEAATADVFDGQVASQTKALSGLKGNTNYYVYIQTVDEANSCVGDWSSATIFRTLCQLQNFPYFEDFQSYTQTGAGHVPDCSTLSGQDANHSYIASRGATGNKALNLRQVTKDHNNYFAFPALNVDSVKRLQLSMMVNPGSTTTTNYYYYEVGVMTDPNDPSTFVSMKVDSVQGAAATVFNEKKYTFENYKGDDNNNYGTFIALKPLHYKNPKNTNYYAGYVYIDDVTIDFVETCFAPSDLKADSLGINGVKMAWTTDDKSATHRVRIFDNASAQPNDNSFIAEAVVNDSVAVLTGLNANTTYYAYVRKECGGADGNSKWCLVCQFKTECALVQELPYKDGFESYDAQTVPTCWTALDNGTNAKCRVYANGSVTYALVGEKGLYINYASVGSSSGSSYYQSSIVTPPLDVENLNELLVYFDYTSISSAGGSLKIEAVSDDTPDAQSIVITQINDMPYKAWKKAYIKIGDYYTSVQPYNRLRFTPMAQGKSVAIDELVITKDLTTILPVEGLKLSMITESSIKFSFVEPTPSVKQWQVAYVAAGGDIADATIRTIDENEYAIEALAANTSYDIYVRGNVDGDEWVGPLTATTLQTPALLPYETDYSDGDKWSLYNVKTVQGAFYPNYFIVGDAANCGGTGAKALYVTNDGSSYEYYTKSLAVSAAASEVWAMRNIKFESAGTYRFSFKVKVPGNKNSDNLTTDYATAHLFPAGATVKGSTATMLDGTTRSGGAATDVPASNIYSLMGKTYQQDEWIWVKKTLDIEESGIYSLAFYWYNASVGEPTGQPLAVDSVIIEEYLCTTPRSFEFTNRAATAVSLKWFGGKCQNFEYVLSEYANLGNPALIEAEDKVAYGTLTDGPQVTINNLLPSTDYSFYVRTICPDGETDWVEYDFNTPCQLEDLPYTEGFNVTPECWILKSATVGTTTVGTSANKETWNRLELASNGYAILPELSVPLNRVEIEVGLFNSTANYGAVSLGIMDNTYDLDTYKEVAYFQTVTKPASTGGTIPTQLEVFDKMLNLYQGTGKVLVLKNVTSNAICVKYVTLTELPDCVRPQQVETTYPTEDAITINWIAGLEEKWEIQLNDSLIKNVTTNPYRITGLEQGTVYTVAVRAICDEWHTSEWSLSTTFTTPCSVNALPLLEDFSGLPQPMGATDLRKAKLLCWDNMVSQYNIDVVCAGNDHPIVPASNVYVGDTWVSNWIGALGDYAQLHSYRRGSPTYRHKWFVSPQYTIDGKATLSFDIRCCNNVGVAPAASTDRTIVAITTDNGATWKKEDITVIEDIQPDYTNKSISLDKYVGQSIRIAFYDENINSTQKYGEQPFVLIDNVRVNCTVDVEIEDDACEDNDYERNDFFISKEDLPAVGETKQFTRFEKAESGCDKNYILKLTTRKTPQIDAIYASICQGEFYEFGEQYLTDPNPEGKPYFISGATTYGCDSTIYLYLTVEESDTTNYANPIVKTNAELPFAVDNYFELKADVLPENETTRTFDTIVVHDGCHFWRYSVTVNRCTVESDPIEESICENAESYNDHGFVIPSEEFAALPAVGETKVYTKTVRNALKCDSTATLRLTVLPNDTTVIPVTLFNNEVKSNNYKVDEIYTIPYGTPVGKFVVVKPNGNKCGYNRYDVDIQQCTRAGEVRATICEHETEFNGYNFVIPSDEFGALPTAGGSKQYTRHDWTAEGCDSTTTLYLNVLINDTADIEVPIQNTDLLNGDYVVDEYFSVPAETEIGADFDTIVNIPGTCEFNKYHVTVTKCEIPVSYTERICEGSESYKGYGFDIEAADMPAPLETKTYERHNLNEWGCDSVITLRLTAWNDTTDIYVSKVLTDLPVVIDDYYSIPSDAPIGEQFIEVRQRGDGCEYNRYIVMVSDCASSDIFEDAICSVETSYEGYGFTLAQEELPAAGETKPYYRDEPDGENSCKHITLKLTVIKNDTTDIYVTKLNTELPFTVDGIYTIPAGTAVGSFVEVLPNGQDCKFNRYNVTIEQATQAYRFTDAVCEDVTNYTGYGFNIAPEDMPAANSYQRFERHGFELDELGVDSIITLTLTVQANDTTFIEEEVFNNELPYMAGDVIVISAGVPFGEQPEVVLANNGTCAYTSYKITVNQCVRESVVRDSICEGIESYMGYGFSMPSAEFGNLPAPGKRIEYVRHETTGEGCDSIITLSLKVMKIDTVRFASIDVQISELPYDIDKFYSIPAGTPLGEGFAIIPNPEDECGYRRYAWNITPCTEKYPLQREFICGDADYVAHGFNIPAAELPAVGESKEFTRTNKNELGCDSIITITLTVNAPDTTNVEKTVLNTDLPYIVDGIVIVPAGAEIGLQPEVIIASTGCVYKRYLVTVKQCTNKFEFLDGVCEGENYNGYGFAIAAAELPEAGDSKDYTRTAKDEAGCDSVITLTLIVNEIDTVDVIEEVLNTQLPYMAGEQVVVPAGAPIGEQPEVILYNGSCIYNRYIITVNPCEENYEFDDDVCAGADYNGYGFSIAAAQLPATGGAVDFTRTAKDEAGCDSLITLTLMVSPSEVIALEPLEISVDALPYKLNDYITIPADLEVGVYEGKVQVPGECLFYSYSLTVHESGWGIINVTDDVESIEVYDLLGRMIFTLRQGEEMKQQLPMGVYMLHTIMKSGATVNSKVVLK